MKNASIQEQFEAADEIGYVFGAAQENSLLYISDYEEENLRVLITDEYDHIGEVKLLERLARKIIQAIDASVTIGSKGAYFNTVSNSTAKQFRQFCNLSAFHDWNSTLPNRIPSPYVKLLIEACDMPDWHMYPWNAVLHTGESCVEYCNRIFKEIRTKSKSIDFLKEIAGWHNGPDKNLQRVEAYIHRLFEDHSRLLAVRLDLGYQLDWDQRWNSRILQDDLDDFLNDQPLDAAFQGMVGYILRIECGREKGFHAHILLFFDGSTSRDDLMIGSDIGDVWCNAITDGEGTCWNCNQQKEGYKTLGTGMVSRDNEEKRLHLLQALTYLAKSDRYLRLSLDEGAEGIRMMKLPAID